MTDTFDPAEEPVLAGLKPLLVSVRKGESYFWCSCGQSATQPFCDGTHKGGPFVPHRFTAERDEEVLLCVCKRTHKRPFCDGTHNNLSETYAEAGEDDPADVPTVDFQTEGALSRALLDNGCQVVRLNPDALQYDNGFACCQLLGAEQRAKHLAICSLALRPGAQSPVLRAGTEGSEMVLFVSAGRGEAEIGGRRFGLKLHCGLYVRPGESLRLHADGELRAHLAICPQGELEIGGEASEAFDDSAPKRTVEVDEQQKNAMADRYYQMLVDEAVGCTQTSQFIGAIPQSRAAHHRHLYEESIEVLEGEGYMWTDRTKAAVRPGDLIFLPLKQSHSLEATEAGGMRLVGLFHPAGSPAVNY